MRERWKPLITINPELLGRYRVSDKGEIKRLPISYDRVNHKGESYTAYKKEKELKPRTTAEDTLLFCSLSMVDVDDNGDKKTITESVYLHTAVAREFVYNPNPKKYTKVVHKNLDQKDNDAMNLQWANPKGEVPVIETGTKRLKKEFPRTKTPVKVQEVKLTKGTVRGQTTTTKYTFDDVDTWIIKCLMNGLDQANTSKHIKMLGYSPSNEKCLHNRIKKMKEFFGVKTLFQLGVALNKKGLI